MSIFDKCRDYTMPRDAKAAGIYPYFTPIQESTATEARIDGEWKVMVGSNNYLGLTHHPAVLAASSAALHKYGSGATGSRFLNGTLDLHNQLEERLAAFLRKPAAVVFTTGYQANLGALSTLLGRDDHLFIDKFDHASIVDASRMSFGEVHRYGHGDLAALARQLAGAGDSNKLVAVDGVFSMEGSIVDLPKLLPVVKAAGAQILVDDAHAIGVLGENGAGTARHFGVDDQVDLIMATFSKSLASVGGVVAGPIDAMEWLRHHARSLIFTASMPPASVGGVLAALDVLEQEPERRERLWVNTRRVSKAFREMGLDIGVTETPIIPVHIGEMYRAGYAWRALFDAGVFTHPIIPPAVPPNSCRIRVSMSSEHSNEQIERVIDAFALMSKAVLAA